MSLLLLFLLFLSLSLLQLVGHSQWQLGFWLDKHPKLLPKPIRCVWACVGSGRGKPLFIAKWNGGSCHTHTQNTHTHHTHIYRSLTCHLWASIRKSFCCLLYNFCQLYMRMCDCVFECVCIQHNQKFVCCLSWCMLLSLACQKSSHCIWLVSLCLSVCLFVYLWALLCLLLLAFFIGCQSAQ